MTSTSVFQSFNRCVSFCLDAELKGHVLTPKRIMGLTWLENKIYVVCQALDTVLAYSDGEAFEMLDAERIQIGEMKRPFDMTACPVNRCLFISDKSENKCVWKVQAPSKEISRWAIDGGPYKLSTTPSNKLLVLLERANNIWCLEIFRSVDGARLENVSLPSHARRPEHVLQSAKGNFIILFISEEESDSGQPRSVWLVSEMTSDGDIVHTFDLLSSGSDFLDWWPVHMAVDEYDQVLVADRFNNIVLKLNRGLSTTRVVLKYHTHGIDRPTRLCYVADKRMLIVGQYPSSGGSFSIFAFK